MKKCKQCITKLCILKLERFYIKRKQTSAFISVSNDFGLLEPTLFLFFIGGAPPAPNHPGKTPPPHPAATTQKTAIFLLTAVRTSNPTLRTFDVLVKTMSILGREIKHNPSVYSNSIQN
jgi:hypothetical protein